MDTEILRVQDVAGVTVVGFAEPDLDSEVKIHAAGDRINALLEAGQSRLLLDFEGVRYVGSSMLGRLVALNRRATKARGRLALCGMSPYLQTVFEVARLDRVLTIRHDVNEALPLFGVDPDVETDVPARTPEEEPDTVDYTFDEDLP